VRLSKGVTLGLLTELNSPLSGSCQSSLQPSTEPMGRVEEILEIEAVGQAADAQFKENEMKSVRILLVPGSARAEIEDAVLTFARALTVVESVAPAER
jgi:hypothetical protein